MDNKNLIIEIGNAETSPCLFFDELGFLLFTNQNFEELVGVKFDQIKNENLKILFDIKEFETIKKSSFFFFKRILLNPVLNKKIPCSVKGKFLKELNCWKVSLEDIEDFEDFKTFNIEIFNPQTGQKKDLNSTFKKENETQWQTFRKEVLDFYPENTFLTLRILKNRKVVFTQKIRNKNELSQIEHFKTLTESMDQVSFGYIDKIRKIRLEYRNGFFQLSEI